MADQCHCGDGQDIAKGFRNIKSLNKTTNATWNFHQFLKIMKKADFEVLQGLKSSFKPGPVHI